MGIPGKPVSLEMKKAVIVLKEYFDRTKNDHAEHNESSVQRVANAFDLGIATVRRVMADYNRSPDFLEREDLGALRGRPPRAIADSLQSTIREYVRSANKKGNYITLESISAYITEIVPEAGFSERTLGRALDRWGFTFGKGTRSQHLKEKDHVVAARQRYLREKRANRLGKGCSRTEVYLDESYVNKNHSNDFIWYWDEDGPWVQKPTGKGERLIIINAITKDGWLPGARLVFKSSRKTGDYHGQMNNGVFKKWFEEKLMPNLPHNSLIIMDNASYHNTLSVHSAPIPSSSKERITSWLAKNGIPVTKDCLKAELIEILGKFSAAPIYELDEMAQGQGHVILRTPPYHPELQPIETCWAVVKNHIARNSDFTMSHLLDQLDDAFSKVTPHTCAGLVKIAHEKEDKFWEEDVKSDL